MELAWSVIIWIKWGVWSYHKKVVTGEQDATIASAVVVVDDDGDDDDDDDE